jgi:predicted RNA-binding Zn-ribbon protein involved in translation (DUF1610 family)
MCFEPDEDTKPTPPPPAADTLTKAQSDALIAALQVLVWDEHTLRYLRRNDPKALQQARAALQFAGAPWRTSDGEPLAEATPPAAPNWLKYPPSTAQREARMFKLGTECCTCCGTQVSLTEDWTLWPWPDGANLCKRCNDARHEVEEYP